MADRASEVSGWDVERYLRPLHRHRWLLAMCALGGLALGVAHSVVTAPVYTSAVKVQVAPTTIPNLQASVNSVNTRTNQPINLDTEAQIVTSASVATIAQQLLNTATPVGALLRRVSVTVPPNSSILRIACTAHSSQAAQRCANAFGAAYLRNRTSVEQASLGAEIAATTVALDSARGALQHQSQVVIDAPQHTAAKNYALALQVSMQTEVNALDAQIDQFTTTVADPGRVVAQASPGVTSKTQRAIVPVNGLVLGVLVGLASIFGIERFRLTVRNGDALRGVGVPLIAEIPAARGLGTAARRRRETIARSRFEQRLASVVTGALGPGGGVVYLAQVSPGQAACDIAADLARTLASVRHTVEVIRSAGSTRAALAAGEPERARVPAGVPGSRIATPSVGWPSSWNTNPPIEPTRAAPRALPRPAVEEMHESVLVRVRRQLAEARTKARFVIIDADAATTDPNAYLLAGLTNASVLVIDPRRTSREDLRDVVDQITVTPSRLLGAIIWRSPQRLARRNPRHIYRSAITWRR